MGVRVTCSHFLASSIAIILEAPYTSLVGNQTPSYNTGQLITQRHRQETSFLRGWGTLHGIFTKKEGNLFLFLEFILGRSGSRHA